MLSVPSVQDIMRVLLGHIGKDRQADALVEKLLVRFDGPGPLARSLAFCLSQVGAPQDQRSAGVVLGVAAALTVRPQCPACRPA